MKTKNLDVFPDTKKEIGKKHDPVDRALLDRLTQIDEEYTKNCSKPIETFEETAESLIGKALTTTDKIKLHDKKKALKHSEKKRIRERSKEMEKAAKSEINSKP